MLAEPSTYQATVLAASSTFAVLRLDPPSVFAVVVVVIDVSVLWWIFGRVGVIRRYFCHAHPFPGARTAKYKPTPMLLAVQMSESGR